MYVYLMYGLPKHGDGICGPADGRSADDDLSKMYEIDNFSRRIIVDIRTKDTRRGILHSDLALPFNY